MYKKVLVPVSGKHREERARKAAARALEICDGELVILHVVEPVAQVIGGQNRIELTKELESEGLQTIMPIIQLLQLRAASFHTRIVPGTPAETIVTIADEEKADCIVMYTDGRDGLESMFFGSITERVLRNTDVDLLAVRN